LFPATRFLRFVASGSAGRDGSPILNDELFLAAICYTSITGNEKESKAGWRDFPFSPGLARIAGGSNVR